MIRHSQSINQSGGGEREKRLILFVERREEDGGRLMVDGEEDVFQVLGGTRLCQTRCFAHAKGSESASRNHLSRCFDRGLALTCG